MDKRTGPYIAVKPFSSEDYDASQWGSFVHRIMELLALCNFDLECMEDSAIHASIEFFPVDKRKQMASQGRALLEKVVKSSVWQEFIELVKGANKIFPEKDLLLKDAVLGRIDLLLQTPQSFIVIDYKLGQQEDAHIKQVAEYVSAIKAMDKDCEGYLFYLSSGNSKLVKAV